MRLYVNAGVAVFSPFENTTEDLFDSLFNTNVKGTFFTIQKFLPVLKDGAAIPRTLVLAQRVS